MIGFSSFYSICTGIDTEQSYPYEARRGRCRFNPDNIGATDTNIVKLPAGNEKALKEAVATIGPIAVGIDAMSAEFGAYTSGRLS